MTTSILGKEEEEMFWHGEADMALEAAQRIVSHTVFCRERERETERANLAGAKCKFRKSSTDIFIVSVAASATGYSTLCCLCPWS